MFQHPLSYTFFVFDIIVPGTQLLHGDGTGSGSGSERVAMAIPCSVARSSTEGRSKVATPTDVIMHTLTIIIDCRIFII
jgi:hypothetical protein